MANTKAVMSDMRQSMSRVEKAKPIIAQILNGGEIIPVEGDDNEVCKLLDMTCGTDYLQAYRDKGLVPSSAALSRYPPTAATGPST